MPYTHSTTCSVDWGLDKSVFVRSYYNHTDLTVDISIFLALTFFMSASILFGVPLWIFGKRFRSFIARHQTFYLGMYNQHTSRPS